MSVAANRPPASPAPLASFLVPGLGQLLGGQIALGLQYLVAAALLWPLCLSALGGGPEAKVLAVLTLAALHAGAGLTALAGERRRRGHADPAEAGRVYRRWGVVVASLAALLIAALFLRWAVTLPNWAAVRKNFLFFLIGRFRSDSFADQRWRLWGFALIAGGALLTYLMSRARLKLPWLPLVLGGLAGGVVLYPTVTPNLQIGGLALSLILALLGITLSLPVGILFGVGRTSDLPFVRWVSGVYVELFRGIPFIAVIFWFYIFVPYVLGDGTQFWAVILALALFTGAYVAEIVRAGLDALPRGQSEAARSLGLSGSQAMTLVVLPQAVRNMVPPLVGQFISLFKDTSLTSIVSFTELFGAGRIVANREVTATFEIYLTVALLYFVFAFALSQFSRRLEVLGAAR